MLSKVAFVTSRFLSAKSIFSPVSGVSAWDASVSVEAYFLLILLCL